LPKLRKSFSVAAIKAASGQCVFGGQRNCDLQVIIIVTSSVVAINRRKQRNLRFSHQQDQTVFCTHLPSAVLLDQQGKRSGDSQDLIDKTRLNRSHRYVGDVVKGGLPEVNKFH
jgi:hypothetical protein